MKMMYRPVLLLLLTGLCAVIAAPPSGEIKEAVDYVTSRVPACKSRATKWHQLLPQVVGAMKSHPKYRRWLLQDEAKAAAAMAASQRSQPLPAAGCSLQKSPSPPTSVHRLRPADIDVVAAMGDSLTAGNGVKATSIIGLLIQYRGYAWSIGGEAPLSEHTTIPNILRNENKFLYGYSIGSGTSQSATSRLNVAEPGNEAFDMPRQAVRLVERLKSDPSVDFENDWKLITLFVGGNDVCDYCKDKSIRTKEEFIKNIRTALDTLHANVPKAFVNVAEVLNVEIVRELIAESRTCQVLTGSLLCKCAAYPENDQEAAEIRQLIDDYQHLLRELVASGRYDTRSDFTVVNQPFFRDSRPLRINGRVDVSMFAPDCFHFSQKGHDMAAKSLWNNMLEPVGKKSTRWDPSGRLLCPTKERPYLMTNQNS